VDCRLLSGSGGRGVSHHAALSAEFKRSVAYRITDAGRMALHLAGMSGSPARSKRTPEQQLVEFRVLDFLAERDDVREGNLRGATRAGKALLAGWCGRSGLGARMCRRRGCGATGEGRGAAGAEERAEASPPLDERVARPHTKLNENQRTLIETLAASGGRLPVEALRGLDVPRTTLGTLVRRGLIELVDEPRTSPRQNSSRASLRLSSNSARRRKQRWRRLAMPWRRASLAACCSMGSLAPERRRCIWLVCGKCWTPGAPRSCWFLRLG